MIRDHLVQTKVENVQKQSWKKGCLVDQYKAVFWTSPAHLLGMELVFPIQTDPTPPRYTGPSIKLGCVFFITKIRFWLFISYSKKNFDTEVSYK